MHLLMEDLVKSLYTAWGLLTGALWLSCDEQPEGRLHGVSLIRGEADEANL